MSDSDSNSSNEHCINVSNSSVSLRNRISSLQSKFSETSRNSEFPHDQVKEGIGPTVSKETFISEYTFSKTLDNNNPVETEDKLFKNVPEDKSVNRIKKMFEGWDSNWSLHDHESLPDWMKDNEYLLSGHRPALLSISGCFQSIFRIHTETVNIWTHMLGCILFIILAVLFLLKPTTVQEKLVFGPFFAGAILCLGFSSSFHLLHCHSAYMTKLLSRLDYCGISLLITGSFIPWLYYGFYCHFWLKIIYLGFVVMLGISASILSLWEKFSEPSYRQLRATVFILFGFSGIIPALHCVVLEGWDVLINHGPPLLSTAFLYTLGATLYSLRIPESIYPGKFDLYFQSHQIFHVLVVIATIVDYCGILAIASDKKSIKKNCM